MVIESLFGEFDPEAFGLPADEKQSMTRKQHPNDSFILVGRGKRKKIEVYITTKEAEEIIKRFDTDRFDYEIDDCSGVIYLVPGNAIQICVSGNKAHYVISISKKEKSSRLFKALGEFRRMFVVIALNTNHCIIVPDRKNDKNEVSQ